MNHSKINLICVTQDQAQFEQLSTRMQWNPRVTLQGTNSLGFESQQTDEAIASGELKRLFVVKPGQPGYMGQVAQLTVSAIEAPEHTLAYIPTENASAVDRADAQVLRSMVEARGVQVFTQESELVEFLDSNPVSSESTDHTDSLA